MTVQDVYNKIDQAAHFSLAMEFDNPGLLVGDPSAEVKGALVALDVTDEVISEAVSRGANLIVTHHPVIYLGHQRTHQSRHRTRRRERRPRGKARAVRGRNTPP